MGPEKLLCTVYSHLLNPSCFRARAVAGDLPERLRVKARPGFPRSPPRPLKGTRESIDEASAPGELLGSHNSLPINPRP